MSEEPIKWISIQPLTGGMYIGAYKAIGHHADCIISFDGLCAYTEKDGQITKAANEYNLRKWLEKNNANVPYYRITNRKMFDTNIQMTDVNLVDDDNNNVSPDFHEVDIVVAVPVCSGMTTATSMPQSTTDLKNSNMKWITYYTLNVIKPKMYVFENAPTLFGSRGLTVRGELEKMAKDAGYSVLYYKTDTLLHHNCQHRQRTFVIFTKWADESEQLPPVFEYENDTLSIQEFFETISKDASQQIPVESYPWNYLTFDYIKYKLGENWTEHFKDKHNLVAYIVDNKLGDDFYMFIDSNDYDIATIATTKRYYNHILDKVSQGKGYYGADVQIFFDHMPAIIFKTIPTTLHYSGKRFCTIREYLSLMGMPEDFVMFGNNGDLARIGQNVPANTARFIVSQMVKTLQNFYIVKRENSGNVLFQDNIKQKLYSAQP